MEDLRCGEEGGGGEGVAAVSWRADFCGGETSGCGPYEGCGKAPPVPFLAVHFTALYSPQLSWAGLGWAGLAKCRCVLVPRSAYGER